MHSHLDGFKGAKSYIGDKLRGSTSNEVKRGLVLGSTFLADQVRVELLEKLISTILECTLSLKKENTIRSCSVVLRQLFRLTIAYTISEERRTPTCDDTTKALACADLTIRLQVTSVKLRIDLTATFYQVQRGDGGVGQTL